MREIFKSRKFIVLAITCILFSAGVLFLALFRPTLDYAIAAGHGLDPGSDAFPSDLEILADARVHPQNDIAVLTNGEAFYEAELEAIRSAERSVNLEAYIFAPGAVADRFKSALVDRARAGVKVNLVVDAVGSAGAADGYFDELTEAGGRVGWYHPPSWHTWDRLNNRTHRELIVVDGRVGFIGGAGIGDAWSEGSEDAPPWRDTMFRVRGEAVASLQSVFIENWLEATGDLLNPREYVAVDSDAGDTPAMVVGSTPSAGGSTRARVLLQTFIASAKERVLINNPYFIPDESLRSELIRAAKDRGVDVKIITPGEKSDHYFTQATSRSLYGDLLQGGVEIYEHLPTFIHRKILIVDDQWCVVGSTNFDHRSFGLNDEVNLVVRSADLARRLKRDFDRDLANSALVSYQEWQSRPLLNRLAGWAGLLFFRQQ